MEAGPGNLHDMKTARIVIIGAGIAGISAARSLTQHGFTRVQILESLDRVGGRIYTKKHGDHVIEMGAQWIHGEDGNPIYKLAKQHRLLDEDDDDDLDCCYVTQTGKKIKEKLVKKMNTFFDNLMEKSDNFYRKNKPLEDGLLSVGEWFDKKFKQYLAEQCKQDSTETKETKKALYKCLCRDQVIHNACNLKDHNLLSWGEYEDCPGNLHVDLRHGYNSVTDLLMKDIPAECLHLNKPVSRIEWKSSANNETTSNICVMCEDGSQFTADHVIVTSSLGYLKAHMDTLFEPKLPTYKSDAINRLGFGTVNKVYLDFGQSFFEEDCESINLVWEEDIPFKLTCVDTAPLNKDGQPWWKNIAYIDRVLRQPNLALMWIGGSDAEIMESVSDLELSAIITEILRKFTGKTDIPDPMKIIRSAWKSNPYVLGSYGFVPVNSSSDDMSVLGEPILNDKEDPLLLFAGEMTDRKYLTTVHGAMLSGYREAQRLIDVYAK